MSPTASFLLISLLFHLLYTASIFDIYFTSPVVHPARRFAPEHAFALSSHNGQEHGRPGTESGYRAPAKRVVLIVGDGLRADTLFKWHTPDVLPPWAERAVVERGKASRQVALSTEKSRTRSTPISAEKTGLATFDAAPHLRRIALQRGAWGVSHTRVPTESRPGHVALIAGMYEDVSAVTKGWKLNPIPFDSLFNQSAHTFSFGSPDILPMFAIGATPGTVDMESYGIEEEDFTSDASNLDLWVLHRFKALLARATTDAALDKQLRSPKTVFFLHLLGLDTTGHTYRPHSPEYVGNLMVVDAIVAEVERLLEDFYGADNKHTAYIFTADHGMSNKGNHGDGEPDNTRTPLVAWGAGLRGARPAGEEQAWRAGERSADVYYRGWDRLDEVWRQDVQQADITPLMAALLGINMPANSEGKLPLDYMQIPQKEAAHASLANALEVLEMYKVKHEERRQRMIRYVAYHGLRADAQDSPGQERVEAIRRRMEKGDYTSAIEACNRLIDDALQGARYVQTYDWLLLVGIVCTGYLGSMLYSLAFLLRNYILSPSQRPANDHRKGRFSLAQLCVTSPFAVLLTKFAIERSPATYYLYAAFAAYHWRRIVDERHVFGTVWRNAKEDMRQKGYTHPFRKLVLSISFRVLLSLLALELMVVGYLHRFAWTVGFLFIGFVWPAVGISPDVKSRHEIVMILWTFCCALCSLFTVGGLDKEESIAFLVASGSAFLLAGVGVVRFAHYFLEGRAQGSMSAEGSTTHHSHLVRTRRVLCFQLCMLVISTYVTASSSLSLQQKKGLPRANQIVAWLVLASCLTLPFLYGFQRRSMHRPSTWQLPSQRLAIVIFAFAPLFVLLSIRDETLFFGCYTVTLLLWAKLEASLFEERAYTYNAECFSKRDDGQNGEASGQTTRVHARSLEKEDVRVAVFFLFFLHVGFFGTGNVASISSFYLSPVYRLVPTFSPFLMAALLIVKTLVPFVVLASILQQLCLSMPHRARIDGSQARKTGAQLAGPPLLGPDSVGGLGLRDAYAIVLLACLLTDVLALNFLLTVRTEGSWLEIGRSITHFAMTNLLQVFMLALSAVADAVVGGGPGGRGAQEEEKAA